MNLSKRIAKNTVIHFLGKLIGLFLSLLVFGFIARHLGQFGFGQFTIIIAYLQALAILADFGLYLIFIQMLSLPDINKKILISNFFTLRIILSSIVLFIGVLVAFFIPQYSKIVKIGIAITSLSFLTGSLIQLITGFFQKNMNMKIVARAEVLSRIILVCLIGLVVWLDYGIFLVLFAIIMAGIINFIFLYLSLKKTISITLKIDFNLWKNILKKAWPVGLSIIFTTIYFKGDTIILSLFKSPDQVGIYGASYRILEALIMFPPIFMGLVLSPLTRAWAKQNVQKFNQIFQKSFDFFVIIVFPLVISVYFFARQIMIFVAGQEFAIAAQPLKILIFAIGLIFFSSLVTYTIIAIEQQRKMLLFYGASALIALFGYFLFIPKYSYIGAAYITVLVEFLVTFFAFLIIYKTTKFLPLLQVFWKTTLASLVMIAWLIILTNINWILLLISSLIVYGLVLYSINTFSRDSFKNMLDFRN
ncbi:oligosaccharide flippase family protein [Patescibacteria group bacterium]|nr:oligosaccharide flippase family protein [Patescibacteria group bacterium]